MLHATLVVALAFVPAAKPNRRPEERSVSVDILSPGQFEAAVRPAPDILKTAPGRPQERTVAPEISETDRDQMVRATNMLSAKVLSDPRSRNAREKLATFAADERMVQLCNLEAMEQIHGWRNDLEPDLVVPYALEEEKLRDRTMVADGAAFRSGASWYRVRFECELSDDGASVVAFQFRVGGAVPRERWDSLGLAEGSELE